MNIGFIGLGKLGLPVATAIAFTTKHKVFGYDINDTFNEPRTEVYFNEWFPQVKNEIVRCKSIEEVVDSSEIVFVAVQTPHHPDFEGITRLNGGSDFDYTYLIKVLKEINKKTKKPTTFALISTVAPNTYSSIGAYLSNEFVNYCYNPFFIAMGTVIPDFINPEFVLLGGESEILKKFYSTIHNKPVIQMSIPSAEITKMAYNTFIGMKIVFANNLMEMAEKFNGNVDDITGALKLATDRIVSTKYMNAGMGDGGGCHPRDNIVLSFLAYQYNMSFDLAGSIMKAREKQAEWLVDICLEYKMPVCVLGLEFKPETDIKTGSPAMLCLNLLKEKGAKIVDEGVAVYLIGCKHNHFINYKFPKGSIVIDPHRYIPDQDFVIVRRLGENKN